MADRSIVVRLQAVVTGFKDQMAQAGKAAGDLADKVEKSQASLDKVGGMATKAGLLVGVGLGAAAKAAIDWESAWAGVTKTVDGSSTELATLEGQLRGMAKTLPASHSEIAAVAEAAGQLGIKTKDVASFTKVMIDLGETTNLTADEAATSLAQLMNVMGTAPSNVGRLGAAIVDLGNKGASTERDIVQMGQRIAAAGKSVGMAETDVLGFAAALASVGVEAEAGGTAISMTFKEIDKAVREGGDSLELIAKTSGMSSEAFQKAWRDDAAGAARVFIEGLGQMQAAGQDANGVLDQLGMTGMRQTDSIMRLAQAGDLLRENLQNSATAWQENTALVAEAGKRYETTESKIKIAWNNIKDSAITAGGVMLPTIADLASKASGLADSFGKLPDGMQRVAVNAGVVAAGGLLAVGGLSKMLTTGLELRSSLKELAAISPKTASALAGVGKVAGVAAAAITVLQIANAAAGDSWKKSQTSADDLANSMVKAQGVANDLNEAFKFGNMVQISGMADSLKRALDPGPVNGLADAFDNLIGKTSVAGQITSQFGEVDKALTSLASSGMGDQAANQFQKVAEAATSAGIGTDRLITLFPQYKAQLETVATSLGVVGLSSQDYVDWMGGKVPDAIAKAAAASTDSNPALEALGGSLADTGAQAEASKEQLEALADQIKGLRDVALDAASSQIAVEEAIAAAAEYRKESYDNLKAGIDDTTEAGRANKEQLMAIAEASKNVTGTTEEVAAKQARAHDAFLQSAGAMHLTEAQAEALWTAYTLIPGEVSTSVDAPGAVEARKQANDFNAALLALPAEKQSTILSILESQGFDAAKAALAAIQSKTVTITTVHHSVGTMRAVADGGMFDRSGFGLVRAYKSGGYPRDVGSIGSRSPGIYPYAGQAGVVMNEEGSGPWEGIVSGHPAKRGRSRAITTDIARRLGGEVTWMADGGVLQYQPSGSSDVARAFAAAVSQQSDRLTADDIGKAVASEILARVGPTLPVVITDKNGVMGDSFLARLDLTAARMGA